MSSKYSNVINWKYNPRANTLESWQSSAYAKPGGGHRTNETVGSKGIGVGKDTGVRDTSGQFECSLYTDVTPLSHTSSPKNPVFFFNATSPSGRGVTIRAELTHRAKNSRYKNHTREELIKFFAGTPVVDE
jgi:hypothetical protein